MTADILVGDCRELLRTIDDNSVDSSVTDPPYELGFMGKTWDSTGIAYDVEVWREVLRVLKPGGHLAAFGGTRTYHRMVCAIEDAGFEIRDSLHWIYGTGFPKSLNVAKAIDKRRNEDEEPTRVICRIVRAAMDAEEVSSPNLVHHFGDCHPRLIDHWAARDTDSQPSLPTWDQWVRLKDVLGIDDAADDEVRQLNDRKGQDGDAYQGAEVVGEQTGQVPGFAGDRFNVIDTTIREPSDDAAPWSGWGTALKPAHEPVVLARKPLGGTVAGSVLEHGTGALNIDACRVPGDAVPSWFGGAKGAAHDTVFGHSDKYRSKSSDLGRWPPNLLFTHDPDCGETECVPECAVLELSSQARIAQKYFPCFRYEPKPSTAEREAGLGHHEKHSAGELTDRQEGTAGLGNPRAGAGRTSAGRANTHPTVKPIALMQWLCRLVTPPQGIVLDPFCGSGTTGAAALRENFGFVGIEKSPEYAKIARSRIMGDAPLLNRMAP